MKTEPHMILRIGAERALDITQHPLSSPVYAENTQRSGSRGSSTQ